MKIIRQSYIIQAPLIQVWEALVDPKHIAAWGGGPAEMNAKVNSTFSLWGGEIWGKNIEVLPEKKLVQEWFSKSDNRKWETPSLVTFTLSEGKSGVKIELLHENVPDADAKDIEQGWQSYYLGPLKKYVEEQK